MLLGFHPVDQAEPEQGALTPLHAAVDHDAAPYMDR